MTASPSTVIVGAARAPRVSVLIPVYNPGHHLHATLTSISGQTFPDFELVVIDDGSTDGSRELLEEFARREPRMALFTRENRGVIATRNQLLEAARGELIAWMDADDISLPERLARQVTALSFNPELVCIGTSAQCIDPRGKNLNLEQYHTSHEEIVADQQRGGGMRFATTMMRRDIATSIGGFREPFKIGEDLDFLMRLGEVGRLGNLRDVLYLYRQSVSTLCATLGPQWMIYRDQILELARQRRATGRDQLQAGASLTIPDAPGGIRPLQPHLCYMRWSRHALANRDLPLAARYSCAAIFSRPFDAQVWKTAARVTLSLAPFLRNRLRPPHSSEL